MKVLGKGGYGVVVSDGTHSIKKFEEHRLMLREVFATAYMKDSKYIVKIRKCNYDKLEMRMDIWNCSLDAILLRSVAGIEKLNEQQKHKIFKDVLSGISDLHERSLVHADLKPGNILVNKARTQAVLSDLGLASIAHRARVDLTTDGYCSTEIVYYHRSHDMFSLVLIALQLFYDYRVTYRPSRETLKGEVEKIVKNQKIKKCLLRMIPENPLKTVKASDVLKYLYKKEIPSPPAYRIEYVDLLEPATTKKISKRIRKLCDKYEIRRSLKCRNCVLSILARIGELDNKKINIYCATMVFAFSIIFGKRMSVKNLTDEIGNSTIQEVNAVLGTITGCSEVLHYMYAH